MRSCPAPSPTIGASLCQADSSAVLAAALGRCYLLPVLLETGWLAVPVVLAEGGGPALDRRNDPDSRGRRHEGRPRTVRRRTAGSHGGEHGDPDSEGKQS